MPSFEWLLWREPDVFPGRAACAVRAAESGHNRTFASASKFEPAPCHSILSSLMNVHTSKSIAAPKCRLRRTCSRRMKSDHCRGRRTSASTGRRSSTSMGLSVSRHLRCSGFSTVRFCGVQLPNSRRDAWFERLERTGWKTWGDPVPSDLLNHDWAQRPPI